MFLIESERGTKEEEKSKDQGRVLVEAVLAKVRSTDAVRARRRCLAISSEARSEPLALLSLCRYVTVCGGCREWVPSEAKNGGPPELRRT
ncbi:hypothetical protein Sjap_003674 [Stephania japonica]|uniref:Uncharacterized protein n=1 Tax=Stephania japonica TaxID=461633 RepID=A0AAP0KRN6_9MAGN